MTLAIAFKGPEGIVLAADSRSTLTFRNKDAAGVETITTATYDNATKMLRVAGQDFVAAVTHGLGAIGLHEPRSPHSLLPELEAELAGSPRLTVEEFAKRLGEFFFALWKAAGHGPEQKLWFLVGGYDEGDAYGKIFQVVIPDTVAPQEEQKDQFGLNWGGQIAITNNLMNGVSIPYQFLPLQDCVDLSIFLINTTVQLMKYVTDVRGVGGAIDVATITRREGFQFVQSKKIIGQQGI